MHGFLTDRISHAPRPIMEVAGHLYGRIPFSLRAGRDFRETKALLENTQSWSRIKLQELQMQELARLLKHAYTYVPYYHHLFDETGLKPEAVHDFLDFEKIPFLTKDVINKNLDSLKATNYPEKDFNKVTTGGSSGIPLVFYQQEGFSKAREMAFIGMLWERVGFQLGRDKRLILRGQVVDNRSGMDYSPVTKELICSTYSMDDEHLLNYFARMKAQNYRFIHGHVSSIALFAQFLLEKNLSHQLQAVLGASEKVFPFQRELVAKSFNTRLFSWYGQSEQVVLAGECEYSENYHIYPEYGYTELIDDDGVRISDPGKQGEIVGTSFNNYAMPLIRYRTGDIGKYSSDRCKCGREYELFEDVEGRNYEYIWTKDGRRISLTGLIFGQHFRAFERIKKMQLYQERAGQVEIRIVKSSAYSHLDETEIKSVILKAAVSGLEVSFNYVDDIPHTERGKHQFLIQASPNRLETIQ